MTYVKFCYSEYADTEFCCWKLPLHIVTIITIYAISV